MTQALEDMQTDLVKVRQSYAEVTASQRRMAKQRDEAEKLSKGEGEFRTPLFFDVNCCCGGIFTKRKLSHTSNTRQLNMLNKYRMVRPRSSSLKIRRRIPRKRSLNPPSSPRRQGLRINFSSRISERVPRETLRRNAVTRVEDLRVEG